MKTEVINSELIALVWPTGACYLFNGENGELLSRFQTCADLTKACEERNVSKDLITYFYALSQKAVVEMSGNHYGH